MLPVHHVQAVQVSQGFADLKTVQDQRWSGQHVLLLHEVVTQLLHKQKHTLLIRFHLSCVQTCLIRRLKHANVLITHSTKL